MKLGSLFEIIKFKQNILLTTELILNETFMPQYWDNMEIRNYTWVWQHVNNLKRECKDEYNIIAI